MIRKTRCSLIKLAEAFLFDVMNDYECSLELKKLKEIVGPVNWMGFKFINMKF